jgi:hypothetical protein
MENVYERYYRQQIGGSASYKDDFGNLLKLPKVYQRGQGSGGIFYKFWKYIQPILSHGANFLTGELIDTGTDVLKGLAQNKPIKDILLNKSVQVVNKLRDNAVNKIKTMAGAGIRKRKQKIINKRAKLKRPHSKSTAKRVKKPRPPRILDIFTE